MAGDEETEHGRQQHERSECSAEAIADAGAEVQSTEPDCFDVGDQTSSDGGHIAVGFVSPCVVTARSTSATDGSAARKAMTIPARGR